MFTGLLGNIGLGYNINDLQEVLEAMAFNGALVYLSVNQSIPNAVLTEIDWDAEAYDSNSFHEGVTNPSRLTIPSGVSKVRVVANITFDTNATGKRSVVINKNGAAFIGRGIDRKTALSGVATQIDVMTAVLEVTAGDYFECVVDQDSGAPLSVLAAAGANTWFAIEVIE